MSTRWTPLQEWNANTPLWKENKITMENINSSGSKFLFLFLFYTLLLNWSDINRKSTRHNLLAFSHPLTRFQQRRSHRILLSKNKSDIRVSPQFPWATLGGTQANAGPRLLDMDATRCQIHDGTTCFVNQKKKKKGSPSTGNDDFTTVQHVNRKSETGTNRRYILAKVHLCASHNQETDIWTK